jgi:hypothetical protein
MIEGYTYRAVYTETLNNPGDFLLYPAFAGLSKPIEDLYNKYDSLYAGLDEELASNNIAEAGYTYIKDLLSYGIDDLKKIMAYLPMIHYYKGHRKGVDFVFTLLGITYSLREWYDTNLGDATTIYDIIVTPAPLPYPSGVVARFYYDANRPGQGTDPLFFRGIPASGNVVSVSGDIASNTGINSGMVIDSGRDLTYGIHGSSYLDLWTTDPGTTMFNQTVGANGYVRKDQKDFPLTATLAVREEVGYTTPEFLGALGDFISQYTYVVLSAFNIDVTNLDEVVTSNFIELLIDDPSIPNGTPHYLHGKNPDTTLHYLRGEKKLNGVETDPHYRRIS